MLRGCQRRVIHLKDPKSQLFDEVYFVIREQQEDPTPVAEKDMLREARRIIAENLPQSELEKKARRKVLALFGASFSLGVAVSVLVLLLIL